MSFEEVETCYLSKFLFLQAGKGSSDENHQVFYRVGESCLVFPNVGGCA